MTRRVTRGREQGRRRAATVCTAAIRSSGGASLSRKPLAPARSASNTYSSRSKVVRTRTARPAPRARRSARVASRPSIAGHPDVHHHHVAAAAARASATAAAPSPASPTTSMAGSTSKILRRPARTRGWSSTSRTPIRHRAAPSSGSRARDREAAAGARPGVELPAVQRDPLPHADQPVPAGRRSAPAPPAVVGDLDPQLAGAVAGSRTRTRRRRRVLERVGQRLLHDAVGRHVQPGRQRPRLARRPAARPASPACAHARRPGRRAGPAPAAGRSSGSLVVARRTPTSRRSSASVERPGRSICTSASRVRAASSPRASRSAPACSTIRLRRVPDDVVQLAGDAGALVRPRPGGRSRPAPAPARSASRASSAACRRQLRTSRPDQPGGDGQRAQHDEVVGLVDEDAAERDGQTDAGAAAGRRARPRSRPRARNGSSVRLRLLDLADLVEDQDAGDHERRARRGARRRSASGSVVSRPKGRAGPEGPATSVASDLPRRPAPPARRRGRRRLRPGGVLPPSRSGGGGSPSGPACGGTLAARTARRRPPAG